MSFTVCDIDTLVTGELNQAEVRDKFEQPWNLFADEGEWVWWGTPVSVVNRCSVKT